MMEQEARALVKALNDHPGVLHGNVVHALRELEARIRESDVENAERDADHAKAIDRERVRAAHLDSLGTVDPLVRLTRVFGRDPGTL